MESPVEIITKATQEWIDPDLVEKIKLGAFLWSAHRGKNPLQFAKYFFEEYPDLIILNARYYIGLYKMCVRADLTLQDIQEIPWWRIKSFMTKITKDNKEDILVAAKKMSKYDFKKYIAKKEYIIDVHKQKEYYKNLWLETASLDDLLECITQKFPNVLLEVTQIEEG